MEELLQAALIIAVVFLGIFIERDVIYRKIRYEEIIKIEGKGYRCELARRDDRLLKKLKELQNE